MFCPYCGAKNKTDAVKCFVCDKPFPFNEPAKVAAPRTMSGQTRVPSAAPPLRYATLGDRLLALILDTIFLAALFVLPLDWFLGEATRRQLTPQTASMIAAGGFLLLHFLYRLFSEAAFGTTLGKAMLGVHVQFAEGSRLKASLIRNLFRIVDGLGFYLIGFLTAMISPRRKRLGDFAAGTTLIEREGTTQQRLAALFVWILGISLALFLAYLFGQNYREALQMATR